MDCRNVRNGRNLDNPKPRDKDASELELWPLMYNFQLPCPPSQNSNVWVSRGRIIQKDSCRAWKKEAGCLLHHIPKQTIQTDWTVELLFIFFYIKKPRAIDSDNRLKPIFDALKERIGIDDSRLVKYTVERTLRQGRGPHTVHGTLILL